MNAIIQKWGNSQGLRLRKEILEALNLSEGDSVKIFVRSGDIVVSPDKKRKKRVDLQKLLSGTGKQRGVKEIDWGAPVGKEVW